MRFTSKPVEEHEEVPLADGGQWEDLVAHFRARNRTDPRPLDGQSRCYVVSVLPKGGSELAEGRLGELIGLVRAQGDHVVGSETVRLARPNPRTYLGVGLCRELSSRAMEKDAGMIVIDAELSPSQTRNLEDETGMAIADREGVVLNVFLKHAKTRRARIQVEVAQLEYLRPRIRGLGLSMDQQAGGLMNARGPGETASELLARRLDGRLAELKRALKKLSTSAKETRRRRSNCLRIALVGYTNAGKTSLMNALTSADLSARNLPFETLDTTTRVLESRGDDVVITDTVGFIRNLPERLVESFESTLAEARDADLIAVVIDVSNPEWPLHLRTTDDVLERLGANEVPWFYVHNKIDRVSAAVVASLERQTRGLPQMSVSARDPKLVSELKKRLIEAARGGHETVSLFVPYENTKAQSLVHSRCRVLHAESEESGMRFRLSASKENLERLRRVLGEKS